ncbi:hypothetical protein HK100_011965 [Physocladia obscura]|uniref:Uncharacterized protein n=1 Tax=Physocladia obscura TaxID=109957 RepID=A0AAD5T318_9FUNG|nr:hypothetical protein HK100_011965 [Physocladia obscura]
MSSRTFTFVGRRFNTLRRQASTTTTSSQDKFTPALPRVNMLRTRANPLNGQNIHVNNTNQNNSSFVNTSFEDFHFSSGDGSRSNAFDGSEKPPASTVGYSGSMVGGRAVEAWMVQFEDDF